MQKFLFAFCLSAACCYFIFSLIDGQLNWHYWQQSSKYVYLGLLVPWAIIAADVSYKDRKKRGDNDGKK